jgi:23S rRNA (uracil1939-C5)-methyltransferase
MPNVPVTIESLAHGGDGVGRLPDGRTVFVPLSCPGDEAEIEVTEDHGRWARGAIARLVRASADRVEPPCPYFGTCGGCSWQHIGYTRQLQAKRQNLTDVLTRIGRMQDPPVEDPLAPGPPYGYRNRIELTVRPASRGVTLGFLRAGSDDLLPVDACLLLPEQYRGLPKALAGALSFLAPRGADSVVRVTVRVARSGETAVELWTPAGPFPRHLAATVLAKATGAKTVARLVIRGTPERRDVSAVETLAGPGVWREALGSDRYTVSPPSFFQVNTPAAARLRDVAIDLLGADGTMRVADLYAGVGTFTLPIARVAGETVAVEMSRYALSDLRRNLADSRLDADIVPGDAAHSLPDIGHVDAAVIDPPRSGLSDKAMRALLDARIGRLVYVSCDPATLARDVQHLVTSGYEPLRFVPVDLYPQTYHLETVALLQRR